MHRRVDGCKMRAEIICRRVTIAESASCPNSENKESDLLQRNRTFTLNEMGEAAKGIPDESEVEVAEKTRGPLLKCLLLVAVLLGLSIAWRWTPISEWINFRTIVEWQNSVRAHPAALLFVVGTYLAGSLVLFPVTILNVATVFTFGPIRGNAYGLAGWLASAALGYAIGRAFKHKLFHRFAGPRVERLLQQAAGHGFLAVLTMRLLPVAPFTLVNIFIGTIPIRFRHFIMASIVGRIPGMIVLTFAGLQLEQVLRNPGVGSFVVLIAVLVLLLIAASWFLKRFKERHERST
jgi:phospholipase D1/2